jgi:hypothetical protein
VNPESCFPVPDKLKILADFQTGKNREAGFSLSPLNFRGPFGFGATEST